MFRLIKTSLEVKEAWKLRKISSACSFACEIALMLARVENHDVRLESFSEGIATKGERGPGKNSPQSPIFNESGCNSKPRRLRIFPQLGKHGRPI